MLSDDRKAFILKAVVEEYIQTAQPVGSAHVTHARGVEVSSATVRNDMALLEQEGYLHQPHTSAGRVPTEKGYRWFVDALRRPALDQTSAQQVRAFFKRAHGELEAMLQDTTQLLSSLTDAAAVVVGPPHEAATVRSVQLVGLAPRVVLFVAVLSNGVVEKRTVDLAADTTDAQVAQAGAALAQALEGQRLDAVRSPRPSGDAETDAILAVVAEAIGTHPTTDGDHVFVGGAARMASSFEAIETVRSVLAILEQQLVVVTLLRDVVDRGLNVAIGTETGMEPLARCSLVVAPYEVDGNPVGTIGVLGPTRMNYPQALAAVAVVGKRLGQRLSEG